MHSLVHLHDVQQAGVVVDEAVVRSVVDAALEGGDLKQVEIQAPNLPGALAAGS